jgi:hypothetical protein
MASQIPPITGNNGAELLVREDAGTVELVIVEDGVSTRVSLGPWGVEQLYERVRSRSERATGATCDHEDGPATVLIRVLGPDQLAEGRDLTEQMPRSFCLKHAIEDLQDLSREGWS